jgi:hypothetical protein
MLEANTTTLLVMVAVAWIVVISAPSVGPDAGLLVRSPLALALALAYGSGCLVVVVVVAGAVGSAPGVIRTITGVRTGVM